ncbi:MAG: bifunctional diaminohydroxyphosphoribosylaminopyrimidine deaminase/5-amino-6-(5-phosphoribosylamino)uracil reductase RibD [Bacteroidetes bacterium]|nr:bifunctional diaminohydroxyphosphoribosylaminopyrimidine deaminase/5-amino-6-(5-phosphoribosylamino)uracil reductase RibD [Bacteroidota bacterium]
MNVHEKYMKRCLELARKGFGKVAPNPMVGCVIVYKEKIIGEGFHPQFGSAHAEVNAINSVQKKNILFLRDSTLYVTLEPCSHFGKTHPCADLIIGKKIKYIVIGTIDPNPLVSGKGLQKLVSSGCDVKLGVLENECRELNKRFFTFHEKKRPYIILKWAQTADGYIGIKNEKLKISTEKENKLVHQWRSEEQGIMVGTNTALVDNPRLTVRKVKGKDPLRIVIDKNLKIPSSFHLLDGSVRTIVFTAKRKSSKQNLDYVIFDFKKNILTQILHELYCRQIQSLIVEGGSKLLNSFLKKNLWDEARVFTAKKNLFKISGEKSGVEAPKLKPKMVLVV